MKNLKQDKRRCAEGDVQDAIEKQNVESFDTKFVSFTTTPKQAFRNLIILIAVYAAAMGGIYLILNG